MTKLGPTLFPAGENVSCATCSSMEEGVHYCLLHSIWLKNADAVACQDWEEKGAPQKSDFMNKEKLLTVFGWVLLGIGIVLVVALVGMAVVR